MHQSNAPRVGERLPATNEEGPSGTNAEAPYERNPEVQSARTRRVPQPIDPIPLTPEQFAAIRARAESVGVQMVRSTACEGHDIFTTQWWGRIATFYSAQSVHEFLQRVEGRLR